MSLLSKMQKVDILKRKVQCSLQNVILALQLITVTALIQALSTRQLALGLTDSLQVGRPLGSTCKASVYEYAHTL